MEGKIGLLFNDGLGSLNIRSLALAPGSPNVLYAGTAVGLFKNIDDEPIVTLNENSYCVGAPWSLTVSNTPPETSVRLMGTSNNRSWEIPNWRKTAPDGTRRETGVFAAGTEGIHYLRVEVVASSRTSFPMWFPTVDHDNILDRLTGSDPSVTDYVLERLPGVWSVAWRFNDKTLVDL